RSDRHRVRGRVAAELSCAHVDRHLATLEPCRHRMRPGAGLLALDPAARVAPLARAEAPTDALAVLARLCRRQVGEAQLVAHDLTAPRRSRDGGPGATGPAAAESPCARRCGRSSPGRAHAACRGGDRTGRSHYAPA